MAGTRTLWQALTSVIQMDGRVEQLTQAARDQQIKIEDLTVRVIRLETQMEMLLVRAGAGSTSRRLP